MPNITLFITTFLLLQIVCFFVGRRASKKMATQDDYFLAGRSVRFFPLLMTLVATQIGGGLILGSAEEAYRYGWPVLLYPIGAALGLMALALGIGKRLSRFNVTTVASLFEVVYGSVSLKKIASLLSIVSLFFILVAQVIASKKFMMSMGASGETFFLILWGIVIAYTAIGGLKAVVATDIIQALFFIAIFVFCFLTTFFTNDLHTLLSTANSETFEFDGSKLTGWILMPLLFMIIEQDMGQKCFAAKSGRTVSLASAFAALITIGVCLIPVFYGIMAKSLALPLTPGSSVFMTVTSLTTSPAISALMACAILAAIISTADSLINAISSNVAGDFYANKGVKTARLLTIAISLLALLVSYSFNNVVDLLILSYELSVSALFAPLFMALFIKRGNALSALSAILLGTTGFLLFRFYPLTFLPREVASLLLSTIGYFSAEFIFLRLRARV